MKCLHIGCNNKRTIGNEYCHLHMSRSISSDSDSNYTLGLDIATNVIEAIVNVDTPDLGTVADTVSDTFSGFGGGESGGGGAGGDF